jgi:MFS family permease
VDQVRARDRWRLGLAAGAVLLAAADTYVVVVALPAIMTGVGVGLDRLQRAAPIISGFLLGYTAVLPLIGRLADLAGTGPVFAGCLAAFGTGSVITATAHALPVVIFGRAVQGMGAGGLVPVAMAMVAARWPPDARGLPLGVVGAVQELGSVVGPVYGAGVVAIASWRAIFWINLPVIAVIGTAFLLAGRYRDPAECPNANAAECPNANAAECPNANAAACPNANAAACPNANAAGVARTRRAGRLDVIGPTLATVGTVGLILGLDAPSSLATNATVGQWYSPHTKGAWAPFTTDVVLVSLVLLAVFLLWEYTAPFRVRSVLQLRETSDVLARSDVPGALALAGVLACIVIAFSTADPGKQVVASSAPIVIPLAGLLAVLFWLRQRTAATPLVGKGAFRARPAWGALLVNLSLGGALMAALIGIPLFARATTYPDSETDAALVLIRFLIAVPIGAVAGGALCRARSVAPYVAGLGMALTTVAFATMIRWGSTSLGGGPRPSDAELVLCGLGFGLAIAPINVAILGAVHQGLHAFASALAVVARTIGMLAGLSALTALALRRFYEDQAKIGSPLKLCPNALPQNCAPYTAATNRALLDELHTIFAGAAVCAALAGVLALLLLRTPRRIPPSADDVGTTTLSDPPRSTG